MFQAITSGSTILSLPLLRHTLLSLLLFSQNTDANQDTAFPTPTTHISALQTCPLPSVACRTHSPLSAVSDTPHRQPFTMSPHSHPVNLSSHLELSLNQTELLVNGLAKNGSNGTKPNFHNTICDEKGLVMCYAKFKGLTASNQAYQDWLLVLLHLKIDQ